MWMSQCASETDCIIFHGKTAGSQVYGHNELILLAFHLLNLVTIHEQGKWLHHFQCILGMREGGKTFSWQNLVWLSDTNAWDDTCRGCHIVVGIGTQMMVIVIVYSAVIVVLMKIAQKINETIYQG